MKLTPEEMKLTSEDRRALDRITNRKVICGNLVKAERYGGGSRYHCPVCDIRTENGLKMANWINAAPPEDGVCHKEKKR